ncbi:uncharacterized protein LOC135104978 isoform X3 [Scylla paramamosain]|uniref:uncharacterized protein LOC135104978 isoform X3 n=1 Tax=Scylla paramamosain TaxID=85552 RepID=UPI003082CD8A
MLLKSRQRKVRIDICAEPNRVTFRPSHLDLSKDQFRYKLDFLACDNDTKFSNWQDAKLNRLAMKILARTLHQYDFPNTRKDHWQNNSKKFYSHPCYRT